MERDFPEKEVPEKQQRQANYDALKILAISMEIIMHYMQKGGVLIPLSENTGVVNLLAWLIEALCIGAVNIFVLLSGYFLVKATWKWQRLLSLAAQVWFYSVGVPLLLLLLGIGNVREWGFYDWITAVLPLQSEHYWFATAYVVLYLFTPVLQAGIKAMSKKQFQIMLGGLLAFFSLEKTLLPVALSWDRYGYDFGWFICLFLIAAYVRLYGLPVLSKRERAWGSYLGCVLLIWIFSIIFAYLTAKGLPLSYMGDMLYSYNHLLVLVLSVGIFMAFGQLTIRKEFLKKLICRISPYCLGVYLLHENIALRYRWQSWVGIDRVRGSFLFIPHMLLVTLLIFSAGILVDYLRERLFGCFGRLCRGKGGNAR